MFNAQLRLTNSRKGNRDIVVIDLLPLFILSIDNVPTLSALSQVSAWYLVVVVLTRHYSPAAVR